jgi:hypothetical protein
MPRCCNGAGREGRKPIIVNRHVPGLLQLFLWQKPCIGLVSRRLRQHLLSSPLHSLLVHSGNAGENGGDESFDAKCLAKNMRGDPEGR